MNDVALRANDVLRNDVGFANDVRYANDVCLTAHRGKHRITRGTQWSNIIFAKQMHHIAVGDASFPNHKATP